MESVKNELAKAQRLTEGPEHCFYGYYDNPAWNKSEKYHLCHRVKFWDRLPARYDAAELGIIDMDSREYIPLAETTAWNFQQGTMLQWNPQSLEDEIIFNIREGEDYKGVIMNIHTKERRYLDFPVANVDQTGRYALSVNFNRMFDFRPGYGYSGVTDKFYNEKHPKDDGIFLVDLITGKGKLIISLEQIWEFTKGAFKGKDMKILINHITFNTDGSRFVFLARNFYGPGEDWFTAILTADTNGSDMYLLSDYSYASHYHWRDPQHVTFHSMGAELGSEGPQLYVLKDKTHEGEIIDREFFLRDGHDSYSPDRNWMLYDSYPDNEGYRHLYLYNLTKKKGVTLGSYYSFPHITGDFRCDLHPRWNPSGNAISFDSIHEGHRHIYYMDLKEIMVQII